MNVGEGLVGRFRQRFRRTERAALAPRDPLAGLSTYEVRHLAAHLVGSGNTDQLHRLLSLDAPVDEAHSRDEANLWFSIHDRLDGEAGYLEDVNLAWQHADDALRTQAAGAQARRRALALRYGLVSSSFVAIAESMPNNLRAALLKTGYWRASRALTDARSLWAPGERVDALIALIPQLTGSTRTEVLHETARLVRQHKMWNRVDALTPLLRRGDAQRLDEDSRAWRPVPRYPDVRPTNPPTPPTDPLAAIERAAERLLDEPLNAQTRTRVEDALQHARARGGSDHDMGHIVEAAGELRYGHQRRDVIDPLAPFLPPTDVVRWWP